MFWVRFELGFAVRRKKMIIYIIQVIRWTFFVGNRAHFHRIYLKVGFLLQAFSSCSWMKGVNCVATGWIFLLAYYVRIQIKSFSTTDAPGLIFDEYTGSDGGLRLGDTPLTSPAV